MSDFNIRKFLAEQEQLAESSTEHDVEHSDQMDDEDYDVPAMESEIISGYDPRLIAQDMIDGGMTATSDANFDDLYAHYMGRNGDPATQYDYELKEAVRAAYKAILKNKAQSGSDFNELPESGGDQYDDMEWGNTGSGEVRPPTDEEYDRAKDQLSTVSDGNIGSIGVDDGTGLMYVMTDDGEEYEIGHNQITYMGNEFSEGAELAGLLEAAGVKHLKGKDKIKGSGVKGYDEPHPTKGKFVGENDVEEAIIPWDSEHSDGDFVDDETGQIHRNEDVIQDPETGEWREKTQQERIGPERWAELERKDAEDKAAWNDYWDSDAEEDQWNIEYRKMNWDAIGDFGDVAGGGGDPIDYVMQKYGLSMDDIDAEAQNQGFSDGHEWASSYSEEGTLESVNEDDPWALGEAGGESRYEQEARDNVERHLGDLGIEDPDELGQEAWTLAYDGALDAGATPDYATQIANKVGQEYGLADGSHLAYESDDPWALGYDDESVSDDDYVIPDEGNDTDWVIPNEDVDAMADDLLAEYGEDEFERGDDWGDDDMYDDVEETSVTIKGDLPAKSYWNKTGKHQDKSEKLETLIPASDEVEDYKNNPALENFRRLANIYHDVYNNGFWDEGMGQRGDEMEEYFGWGPGQTISTDDLEDMVSKNTLAAWREQSKKGTLEETMSGAFATGAMREDDEEDEYFDDEERADMASDADRDSMIDIMGDDIVLTPGQIVRVSSELGGEAAVVAQRDNYIVVNLPRGGMKLLRNDEWWLEDHEDSGEYIDVDYSEDDPEELHFESKKKISNEGFGRRYVPHQHSHEEDKRLFKQQELQHELRGEEGINNYAIFIGGKHWKTVKNERHAGAIVNSLKKKGKDAEYRYGAFPMNETMTIKSITSPKLKLTRQIKAYFPHDDLDEIYGWMKSAEEYGQPLTVDEYADWRSMDDEGNPKTEGASTFKKGPKMKGGGYNKPNKPKQKKAASKAGRQADKKAMDEGYKIMPPMDPKYIERDGLEGPFTTHSGKVVYYDPKAGKHYDPDTDMYMDYDEYAEYDRNPDMEYPEYTIPAPKPKERGRMDERWTDEDDGDYAYDNWKDKEMERDIEAGYKSSKEAKAAKKDGSWNAPSKVEEAPRSNQAMFNRFGMKKLADFIKAHPDHADIAMAKKTLSKKKRDAKEMSAFRARMKAKGTPQRGTKYKYTIAKQVGGDDGYQWAVIDKKTGRSIINGLTKPEVKYYRDKAERDLAAKYEAAYKPTLEPGEEMLDELFNSEINELETATDKLDQDRELGEPTQTNTADVDADAELQGIQQLVKNMMQEPDKDMEDAIQGMAMANTDPDEAELDDDEVDQLQQLLGLLK